MLRLNARALLLALTLALPASAEPPPLIPREILFGNPKDSPPIADPTSYAIPQLSPDGKSVAYLLPDEHNHVQVWVRSLEGNDKGKPVTSDPRGIHAFRWAEDGRTLLFFKDKDGDENWHILGVDLPTGNVRDYTPVEGVRADLVASSPAFPDTLLVSINLEDRTLTDIYRLTLSTGALERVARDPGGVSRWVVDSRLRVRALVTTSRDGGTEIRVRDDEKAPWRSFLTVGPEELLDVMGFADEGRALLLLSSIGGDKARLVEMGIKTRKQRVLAASEEADAIEPLLHPRTQKAQAVAFNPARKRWTVVDPAVKADFEGLEKLFDGDFNVISRDHSDRFWLVQYTTDKGAPRIYAWDRQARSGRFLFHQQAELEKQPLAPMRSVSFEARDGLKLQAYLTLPLGVPARKLPMVVYVHGGPWLRDWWGFSPYTQWFANRGYAVLQVNFRGSSGFGKKFMAASYRQWGLAMQDDLVDAVDWAVREGYADPERVAIYGFSYGGYAALAGAAFTPKKFACAVDHSGPANLISWLRNIPPYWEGARAFFDARLGKLGNPQDEKLLETGSPLFRVDRIERPLLVGAGANDVRAPVSEAEQIVAAIKKRGGRVTYVLYPDEGHGLTRAENNMDFNARVEAFLARCLGGRAEPLGGERVPGSTAVVTTLGE
ncbi:S9 family peptidase [Archangium violaceum]|uniref:S9 family peptidase n=1 Tax=Archangium violaceum TaxID=83451 RepID=UPI0019500748|nr:S9 family peptidase [Archangium violaceum]QRO00997.1 S9 family peptidase [Archangium violaceum]